MSTSTGPSSRWIRSYASAICDSTVASLRTGRALPPAAVTSAASLSITSALLASSATLYLAANRRARAAPRPSPTPTTTQLRFNDDAGSFTVGVLRRFLSWSLSGIDDDRNVYYIADAYADLSQGSGNA